MKASDPNTGLPLAGFGSQVLLVMKRRPMSWRAGQACFVVVIRISARMASTSRPVASVHQEKRRSKRAPLLLPVKAGGVGSSWVILVVTSTPRGPLLRGGGTGRSHPREATTGRRGAQGQLATLSSCARAFCCRPLGSDAKLTSLAIGCPSVSREGRESLTGV